MLVESLLGKPEEKYYSLYFCDGLISEYFTTCKGKEGLTLQMSTSVNVDEGDVAIPNSLCWELIFCNAVNQQLLDKEKNINVPKEMFPCEKYILFSN